jgi:hypothetical protein
MVRVVVVAVLAAGCADRKTTPVPVGGTVTVEGKAAAGAVVLFQPVDPGGKPASGTVGPDGSFRLSTDAAGDGAVPGKYKVVIQPAVQGGGTPYDDPAKPAPPVKAVGPRVPERYTRPDQTPLTQDVPPPGPVVIDLPAR